MIFDFKWKIATGAAMIAMLVASVFLVMAQIENRHLVKMNTQLDARINAPTTGLIAQLAQVQTNSRQLEAALVTQNQRLRAEAVKATGDLATLTARVTTIQRENMKLRAEAASLLNRAPQGDTLEKRILDIDRRNLETL